MMRVINSALKVKMHYVIAIAVIVYGAIFATLFLDGRPVQQSLERWIEIPKPLAKGAVFFFHHKVVRLRNCETESVAHYLRDEKGRTWLLRTSPGEQRRVRNVPIEYITPLTWPTDMFKSGDTFTHRIIIRFDCNFLRRDDKEIYITEFKVP